MLLCPKPDLTNPDNLEQILNMDLPETYTNDCLTYEPASGDDDWIQTIIFKTPLSNTEMRMVYNKGRLGTILYKVLDRKLGIDVGILNAKMPFIVTAKNEAQNATVKKIYDKIQAGESLIVWKDIADGDEIIPTKDPFESWINDYQKTYIVSNLLEDMQTILDSFYKEIGLPVAIEKKERLITSEADFASAQSQARISCWMETLRESLEKVNRMFDLNIQAYTSYELDEEGEEDERPDNADRN
jgi:hypothetical protein